VVVVVVVRLLDWLVNIVVFRTEYLVLHIINGVISGWMFIVIHYSYYTNYHSDQ